MRVTKLPMIALATMIAATPAMAQTGDPMSSQQGAPTGTQQTTPTDPAAPTGAAPSTAAPATGGAVSDAEIDKFASAVVEVEKINKDAAIPAAEKQTKMASAVTTAGLTPERFNAIGSAMSSDTALQGKVSAAVQAKAPAAGATTPPAGQ